MAQGSDAERSDDSENPAATPDTANSDAAERATPDAEQPERTRETAEKEPLSGRERLAILWRNHRPRVLASAAALVAAAAGGTALTIGLSEQQPAVPAHTVAVTYQVTGEGTATISYNSGHAGEPRKQQSVELPWSKELRLDPASGKARVSIVLGKNGGRAQCTVAVDGRHRQRSTAFGDFGRASCAAKVPEKAAGGAS